MTFFKMCGTTIEELNVDEGIEQVAESNPNVTAACDLVELNKALLAECDRLRGNLKSVWAKASAAAERRGMRLLIQMPQQDVELIEISHAISSSTPGAEDEIDELDGQLEEAWSENEALKEELAGFRKATGCEHAEDVIARSTYRHHAYGQCSITGPDEDVAFIFGHLPDASVQATAVPATHVGEVVFTPTPFGGYNGIKFADGWLDKAAPGTRIYTRAAVPFPAVGGGKAIEAFELAWNLGYSAREGELIGTNSRDLKRAAKVRFLELLAASQPSVQPLGTTEQP